VLPIVLAGLLSCNSTIYALAISIQCMISLAWLNQLAYSRLSVVLALIHVFILLVCPGIYLRMYETKFEIQGPWDYNDSGEKGAENI
jgi:hypothetical protein